MTKLWQINNCNCTLYEKYIERQSNQSGSLLNFYALTIWRHLVLITTKLNVIFERVFTCKSITHCSHMVLIFYKPADNSVQMTSVCQRQNFLGDELTHLACSQKPLKAVVSVSEQEQE